MTKIENHSGSKYLREIKGTVNNRMDVYAVLVTFDVKCPGIQHAVKKLLCTGVRGKGDSLQDLREARDAISRAIELEEERLAQPRMVTIKCDTSTPITIGGQSLNPDPTMRDQ